MVLAYMVQISEVQMRRSVSRTHECRAWTVQDQLRLFRWHIYPKTTVSVL